MPAKIKIDAKRLSDLANELAYKGLELKETKAQSLNTFDSFIGYAKGDKIVLFQSDDESPTLLHKAFIKKVTVLSEGLVWCAALEKLAAYAKSYGKSDVTVGFTNSITFKTGKPGEHDKSFANIVIKECTAANKAKAMFDNLMIETDEVKDKDGNVFDIVINTTSEEIQKIVEDTKLVGGTYFPISIKTVDGKPKLHISVKNSTDSSERDLEAEIKGVDGEFRQEYSYGFDPVFSNLSGKVEIRLSKTIPLMIVKSEGENEFHRFVIAPKAEDDEKEEQEESAGEGNEVGGENDGTENEASFEDLKEENAKDE